MKAFLVDMGIQIGAIAYLVLSVCAVVAAAAWLLPEQG